MKADPVLKMVIQFAIRMGDSTQGRAGLILTLQVGGLLVTGRVISARQFLLAHPLTDRLLEGLESPTTGPPILVNDVADDGIEFVHLAEAFFSAPLQPKAADKGVGVFWRVRLADVSAFSLPPV